ncbi:transposase, partial [candidate division MSBL1 archaeon SCGC-AAA259O05]
MAREYFKEKLKASYRIVKEKIDPYSSKYSKKKFTLQQHAVIICLKIRSGSTYKEIVERLVEEPRIRRALDLEEVPHPTTLVKAFERLRTRLWRVFLRASADLLEKNGIVGVDASGFERSHASHHYTKRA